MFSYSTILLVAAVVLLVFFFKDNSPFMGKICIVAFALSVIFAFIDGSTSDYENLGLSNFHSNIFAFTVDIYGDDDLSGYQDIEIDDKCLLSDFEGHKAKLVFVGRNRNFIDSGQKISAFMKADINKLLESDRARDVLLFKRPYSFGETLYYIPVSEVDVIEKKALTGKNMELYYNVTPYFDLEVSIMRRVRVKGIL